MYLVPSCVICDFRDVVQIKEGVLRMYSNLIVVVCYLLNCLYIWRRDLLGNLEWLFVKMELKKVLREVKEFRVVTNLSLIKVGSPWVKACVIQNKRCSVVVDGLKGFFFLICSDVGVEPK